MIDKLSMGAGTADLVAEVWDDPALGAAERRRQGTGEAVILRNLSEGQATDLLAVAEARARFWDRQPRGSGGAGKRSKLDNLAKKIRTLMLEQGIGQEAEGATAISPKGLPMKAKGVKSVAAFGDKPAVIEPKLDGWRGTAHIGPETIEIWIGAGRRSVHLHVEHITEQLKGVAPPGTILDGELVVMTSAERPDDWGGIAGILQGSPKPEARQQMASFAVFDVISLFDEDLRGETYETRRRYLEKLNFTDDVWLVPQLPAAEETIEHLIAHGYEGGVIKALDGRYHSGRRSSQQGKIKARWTEDVTVTGFTEGGGDFTGYIGAIKFKGITEDGIEVEGQCSGMDWKTRVHMTENPDEWIGSVIEVKHNGILAKSLRHPQFQRRRPDK